MTTNYDYTYNNSIILSADIMDAYLEYQAYGDYEDADNWD